MEDPNNTPASNTSSNRSSTGISAPSKASTSRAMYPGQPQRQKTKAPVMPITPSLTGAIEAPILREQINDHGREKVYASMRLALAQTIDVMAVNQPTNPAWQEVFVHDFLAKYDTETLDDFALFLQMFRRGELGETGKPQLYGGRVDGTIMFECFVRYLGLKVDARESMHTLRKGDAYAKVSEAVNQNPKMRELAERLRKEGQQRETERRTTLALEAERHKQEGVLKVERAMSADVLHGLLLQYPYQSVRNMAVLRCKDLGIDPSTVVHEHDGR